MNSETALLVTVVVAVLVVALAAVFVSGTADSVAEFLTGGDDEEGVIDCKPPQDENCPEIEDEPASFNGDDRILKQYRL